MSYVTKNYEDKGGDRTVIGGELDVVPGGKITANGVQAAAIAKPTAGATIDAEARTAIGLVIDALKSVGITL